MSARSVPAGDDPTRPGPTSTVTITVDDESIDGVLGQSIAGIIVARDRLRLRSTSGGAPRGVFCGIGVCFDCLVTVNGVTDVRACQRLAVTGDDVRTVPAGTAPRREEPSR